ncbi:MAG: YggS family pyridoxal phosphate-dependent enzyme [Candidatus Aerophobetes bacterium]|nr:YggS family pyridoxal phosphate-dependent enzyme [Candidatus Aerophobetes bacterium]
MGIKENVKYLLEEIPENIILVAAAKTRTPEEILKAIDAGIKSIGENYIGEAKRAYIATGKRAKWHFIGIPKTQKHDLLKRKTLEMFDIIETVDSFEIAAEIGKRCAQINKVMPILIEINSGREPQKSGVLPEKTIELMKEISNLQNIKIMGLMTMGPRFGNPEDARPYFKKTREILEKIKEMSIPNVEMRYLSMGMSNSYRVAIEEGANIVRIGTKIFGPRE